MTNYSLTSIIPFIGLLLSISLFPLLINKIWEKYQNYIIAFWGILACIFIVNTQSLIGGINEIWHQMYWEYIPFILVISALYLITTNISMKLSLIPKPSILSAYLGFGSILASFIGTTGASIILIQPLINLIHQRKYKTHTIIFFIFLVSNCGGSLTPLGDPPLLMGFLNGINFFWPLKNLFFEYIITIFSILTIFYLVDVYFLKKENIKLHIESRHFAIKGIKNFILLGTVIGILFLMGVLKDPDNIFLKMPEWITQLFGIIVLSIIIFISISAHKTKIHFAPIEEVAKIFIVIFIAIIPITNILENPTSSYVLQIKEFVNKDGMPNPFRYFWVTGILSAFLDNAPSYLLSFKMAGGKATEMMTTFNSTLKGISLGSIFMGALTYIGNAPNLMIRSIARDNKIYMPSFLTYFFIAIIILSPVFFCISYFFL